jgi:hypothetical protein
LTVDVSLSAVDGEELEARIKRAVRSYHVHQEGIVQADFAATAALALLQMRPPADAGERAAGVRDGLDSAARTILRLAGIPDIDHQETTHA